MKNEVCLDIHSITRVVETYIELQVPFRQKGVSVPYKLVLASTGQGVSDLTQLSPLRPEPALSPSIALTGRSLTLGRTPNHVLQKYRVSLDSVVSLNAPTHAFYTSNSPFRDNSCYFSLPSLCSGT